MHFCEITLFVFFFRNTNDVLIHGTYEFAKIFRRDICRMPDPVGKNIFNAYSKLADVIDQDKSPGNPVHVKF